ncbi:MAG TPA: ABC transporter ATP-binding protein [Candidatus Angelobacter sp.]|nr:ABC transporter ATP-binding protein [Candidatus Angelobacter sp.]
MIHCRDVTKTFEDLVAVEHVSFEIRSGICALLGPNGAGKSTLLKILTGLLPPDSGEVRIAGLDVKSQSLQVRRTIGVVPEDLGLFDSLTIQEHLELTGPIYGLTAGETHDRAGLLLRILGLDDARDTFLDQCSHGMRKKTALAVALLHNPRVLFLDEPFEGIDPVASKTIQQLLQSVASRGIAVFLTSHILSIVDRLATEIMMIREGRIVWSSSAQTVSRSLEEIYFELVESAPLEDLAWLRSSPS